ncbi:reverse transcriptase family protein [Marinilabilia salmonicolor]|uniref:reverse transcriptase family protein n=1 Tax=Marinilabilia salmonicolor TaxID=989 RepID=UPI00029AE39D|nr:reverse transcriptase family protein [Marinilabilia salmonicolor]
MINTLKHLAFILKVNLSEIESIIQNIDKYYTERVITKEGKNGKTKSRTINPSHNRLKVIQKRIQKNILLNVRLPDYAYGAVKGRDNVDNTNVHKGKKYKFTTDLRNFFPSISHHHVFKMFRLNDFSPEVSRVLTQLTTYKGKLPQGSPTSSTIANLVFVQTGNNLSLFAKQYNITFTSFVDDLTFSSPVDFKEKSNMIIEMVTKDGFKISHNKTNYSRNPIVTGLIPMNNYLRLPDSFMDKLKDSSGKTKEQIKGLLLYKQKVDRINGKIK